MGAAVELAVRAERVRLLPPGGDSGTRLVAQVSEVVFEGDRFVYEVRAAALGDAALRLFDLDPLDHARIAAGAVVSIGWSDRDAMVFSA